MNLSNQNRNTPRQPRPYKYFFCGPIPWDWLKSASKLNGKAFELGIIYWHQSKLNKRETRLKAQERFLRDFSIHRQSYYRALKHLEKAGLVRVTRLPGQKALVDIIVPEASKNLGAPP